jgi:peptidoglycan/xylan/chitin deacetylase (PgdA/CDA1 family)
MKNVTGHDVSYDLGHHEAAARALKDVRDFARLARLSPEEKDELVVRWANALGVEYGAIVEKRILHIMTAGEVAAVAAGGMDIQLHTHRHRTPSDKTLFLREIEDNRTRIEEMTGSVPTHFCYPSGVHEEAFLPWLREAGVESATTCDPGITTRGSDPLLLPRLVDSSTLSAVEFEGWLAGVADMLPRRARA